MQQPIIADYFMITLCIWHPTDIMLTSLVHTCEASRDWCFESFELERAM